MVTSPGRGRRPRGDPGSQNYIGGRAEAAREKVASGSPICLVATSRHRFATTSAPSRTWTNTRRRGPLDPTDRPTDDNQTPGTEGEMRDDHATARNRDAPRRNVELRPCPVRPPPSPGGRFQPVSRRRPDPTPSVTVRRSKKQPGRGRPDSPARLVDGCATAVSRLARRDRAGPPTDSVTRRRSPHVDLRPDQRHDGLRPGYRGPRLARRRRARPGARQRNQRRRRAAYPCTKPAFASTAPRGWSGRLSGARLIPGAHNGPLDDFRRRTQQRGVPASVSVIG